MNDAFKIGMKRKEEYAFSKPLISKERYKPEQILSLSIDKVTTDTGYKMLQGLYPMAKLNHPLTINFLEDHSYLWETAFAQILMGMTDTWTDDTRECSEFPVYQLPNKLDTIISSSNCEKVNPYLDDEAFRSSALEKSLAENSYRAFLSRTLMPVVDVLTHVITSREKRSFDNLKYLILNVQEMNIANLLRFLGYWDEYGYDKPVKFSSSVRLELVSRKERFWQMGYYMRVIYDDEVIKLPWCSNKGYLCPATEFIQYFENNLIRDKATVDQFCEIKKDEDVSEDDNITQ